MKKTEVKPFRGLRYNPDKATSLSGVITPPYDVITPDAQRHFHDKDPHSSIRLDFGYGSESAGDDDRYARSARVLDEWVSEGILAPDERPAFYWCREEYTAPDGTAAVREGFFAALRLVDFSEGVVLPHENTSPGPKADRLALMAATEANLSPIFCLYSDPGHEVNALLEERTARQADATATDEAGTRHSLWVIDDDRLIAAISSFMSGQKLMIADGHHRYETALAYRDERRRRDGSDQPQPYDYMMVYLSNTDNPGMTIFPLHRLVSGLSQDTIAGLPGNMEPVFEIEELDAAAGVEALLRMMAERGDSHNCFGMHISAEDRYILLTSRQPKPIIADAGESLSPAFRSLDVAVLDRIILADILQITPGGRNESATVRFVERAEISPEEISRADHQVMILMNATTMDEVKTVSEAGEKMPKKSTYFYPKPVTGMVFRGFRY
ncbi:MAG: DUF1015 domain-containing protein [Thermoleophilia bacterium]